MNGRLLGTGHEPGATEVEQLPIYGEAVRGTRHRLEPLILPTTNAATILAAEPSCFADKSASIRTFTCATSLILCDHEITLRPFEAQDVEMLYEATIESLADLCGWMNWCRQDYSLDHCRQFLAQSAAEWESGEAYNFAIVDSSNQSLCGSIGLNRIDYAVGSANVGYWVRRSKSGRGIASKALRLSGRFAFEELRLERVEIVVPQGNLASRRVAEKAGARLNADLLKNVVLNDQSLEAHVYWLLPLVCTQSAGAASVSS